MAEIYIWGDETRWQTYQKAIALAGGTVRFGAQPADCDALVLTGGGDLEPWRYGEENTASRGLEPERDEAELSLLAYFARARRPVLGICRGLQVINVYFGGTLRQHIAGHSAMDGGDRHHTVWTRPSRLRELCGARCVVNSAHHQAVGRLGRGLRVLQRAEDGTVEAVEHAALPVLGLQWHPERLGGVGDTVLAAFCAVADQTKISEKTQRK